MRNFEVVRAGQECTSIGHWVPPSIGSKALHGSWRMQPSVSGLGLPWRQGWMFWPPLLAEKALWWGRTDGAGGGKGPITMFFCEHGDLGRGNTTWREVSGDLVF